MRGPRLVVLRHPDARHRGWKLFHRQHHVVADVQVIVGLDRTAGDVSGSAHQTLDYISEFA
jgi:hypothetical protein